MKKTTMEFLKAALPVAMILSASWNASASLSSIKTDESSIRKEVESTSPEFVEANESEVFVGYGCNGSCRGYCDGTCQGGCSNSCRGGCVGNCFGSCYTVNKN